MAILIKKAVQFIFAFKILHINLIYMLYKKQKQGFWNAGKQIYQVTFILHTHRISFTVLTMFQYYIFILSNWQLHSQIFPTLICVIENA